MGNVIRRADTIKKNEKLCIGIAPWVVSGECECGNAVTVRVYGLRSELTLVNLDCEDCPAKFRMEC